MPLLGWDALGKRGVLPAYLTQPALMVLAETEGAFPFRDKEVIEVCTDSQTRILLPLLYDKMYKFAPVERLVW